WPAGRDAFGVLRPSAGRGWATAAFDDNIARAVGARRECCEDRPVQDGSLIARFARARRDPTLAVLEGLHALKHALRFGATVLEVVARDPERLHRLPEKIPPDAR